MKKQVPFASALFLILILNFACEQRMPIAPSNQTGVNQRTPQIDQCIIVGPSEISRIRTDETIYSIIVNGIGTEVVDWTIASGAMEIIRVRGDVVKIYFKDDFAGGLLRCNIMLGAANVCVVEKSITLLAEEDDVGMGG